MLRTNTPANGCVVREGAMATPLPLLSGSSQSWYASLDICKTWAIEKKVPEWSLKNHDDSPRGHCWLEKLDGVSISMTAQWLGTWMTEAGPQKYLTDAQRFHSIMPVLGWKCLDIMLPLADMNVCIYSQKNKCLPNVLNLWIQDRVEGGMLWMWWFVTLLSL